MTNELKVDKIIHDKINTWSLINDGDYDEACVCLHFFIIYIDLTLFESNTLTKTIG